MRDEISSEMEFNSLPLELGTGEYYEIKKRKYIKLTLLV